MVYDEASELHWTLSRQMPGFYIHTLDNTITLQAASQRRAVHEQQGMDQQDEIRAPDFFRVLKF
jgi:hypothetical protein